MATFQEQLNCVRNAFTINPDSTHVPIKKGSSGHLDVLIVHGWPFYYELWDPKTPKPSEDIWIPGLVKRLRKSGLAVAAPDMPNPFRPNYKDWKNVFEQYVIDEDTIVIGHSCGGGFLVHYFSEPNAPKVREIILLAPWMNQFPGSTGIMKKFFELIQRRPFPADKEFFDFKIARDMRFRTVGGITLIRSDNDEKAVDQSIDIIFKAIDGIKVYTSSGRGHFLTKEIPEIVERLPSVQDAIEEAEEE